MIGEDYTGSIYRYVIIYFYSENMTFLEPYLFNKDQIDSLKDVLLYCKDHNITVAYEASEKHPIRGFIPLLQVKHLIKKYDIEMSHEQELGLIESMKIQMDKITKERVEEGRRMNKFETITAAEAKDIMDNQSGYVILDVREADEFAEGHIENAVQLSHAEIDAKAEDMLKDKNQLILVYCRSGRRSVIAATSLAEIGYTDIKNFGGIMDWPYEIVK